MSLDSVEDWSTTAALNTSLGALSTQGSASANTIDNIVREMMAQIAVYRDSLTSSGGGTSGVFTPGLNFGGGNTGITYTSRSGVYATVADLVYFKLSIVLSSKGSSTGDLTIDTFPFTVTAVANPLSIIATGMTGLSHPISAEMASSGDSILVYAWGATGVTALQDTACTNTSTFRVSGLVRSIV